MKKKLYDLTIEEFVRLLCDVEGIYTVTLKQYGGSNTVEKDEIKGTYENLYDLFYELSIDNPNNEWAQKAVNYIENTLFDYNMSLSYLDVYNYLSEKTNQFEPARIKIVLQEIDFWHFMIDEERVSIVNDKIASGWNDYCMQQCVLPNCNFETVDYDDAYEKIFGPAYDFTYHRAVLLLKDKMGKTHFCSPLPESLDTHEARRVLNRAIDAKILDNSYQCVEGVSIYQKRRFAELASEELGIKTKWKTFETLWDIKGLAQVKMYEADQGSLKKIDALFTKEIIDRSKVK